MTIDDIKWLVHAYQIIKNNPDMNCYIEGRSGYESIVDKMLYTKDFYYGESSFQFYDGQRLVCKFDSRTIEKLNDLIKAEKELAKLTKQKEGEGSGKNE